MQGHVRDQQRRQRPARHLAADPRVSHGRQPARRANIATTAMAMATAPKINCRMLKPRNGIWTSNSITNNALASKTATGAQAERREASHAANPDGTATLRNSHPAGSVQLEKPKGLSTDTGGVATPARSWMVPASPPRPTRVSVTTMARRNG